jgi:hypothetical protein
MLGRQPRELYLYRFAPQRNSDYLETAAQSFSLWLCAPGTVPQIWPRLLMNLQSFI